VEITPNFIKTTYGVRRLKQMTASEGEKKTRQHYVHKEGTDGSVFVFIWRSSSDANWSTV